MTDGGSSSQKCTMFYAVMRQNAMVRHSTRVLTVWAAPAKETKTQQAGWCARKKTVIVMLQANVESTA